MADVVCQKSGEDSGISVLIVCGLTSETKPKTKTKQGNVKKYILMYVIDIEVFDTWQHLWSMGV